MGDNGPSSSNQQPLPADMADAEAQKKKVDTQNEVPWMFRLLGRILATVGAGIMVGLGVLTMISFTGSCIISGILMICFGALVIVIEAPMFCSYFKCADVLTKFVDNRPYFLRAGFYFLLSIVPFVFCQSLSSFFGCGALFTAATFYGVIAIGKKGGKAQKPPATGIQEDATGVQAASSTTNLVPPK